MSKLTKALLVVIAVLTMLFSSLPLSIGQAKKSDVNVTLTVKNRTGGKVSLLLIDENGKHQIFVYQPGITQSIVYEGHFRYYASTPCGNQSGQFNLNVTKELFFGCSADLQVDLTVPVHVGAPDAPPVVYCYSVWDFPDSPDTWIDYGPHCQSAPAKVGDKIPNEYDPVNYPGEKDTVIFSNSGSMFCAPEHGSAYYFHLCSPK